MYVYCPEFTMSFEPRTPELAIQSPVIVQTTIVSQNVPVMFMYP